VSDSTDRSFVGEGASIEAYSNDESRRGNLKDDTDYAYDPLERVVSGTTTNSVGGATVAAYTYTYNAAGQQQTGTSNIAGDPSVVPAWNNGTSSYSYDSLGRLGSANTPALAAAQSYGWNSMPDRASVSGGGTSSTTTYNLASQPISTTTSGSGFAYKSDKEGRLLSKPGQTLHYDTLGRLIEVDDTTTGTTTYKYDPADRLVSATNGGVTTTYLYVGLSATIARVIVTAGTTTSVTNHATDLGGNELYECNPANPTMPTYLGRNGHGDVTWSVGPTGVVTGTAAYDPFGGLIVKTGSLTPAWQGSLYQSSTGLYYVQARWYSPTMGRFLSDDPLSGTLIDPQTLDHYAYGTGERDIARQYRPIGALDDAFGQPIELAKR
jgi:RHS repeat-associated protein